MSRKFSSRFLLWLMLGMLCYVPVRMVFAQPETTMGVTESCQNKAMYYQMQIPTTATQVILNTSSLWRQAYVQNLSTIYSVSWGTDSSVVAFTGSYNAAIGYQLTYNSNSSTSQALFRMVPGNSYYMLNNGPNGVQVLVDFYLCR